ncbi:quinone reductase [Pyrenophora seminiperda CCB06]|uniref:Quinone reductase n=1 Tax=Pyrenophora seminiperda CCB06 TaxID=1302712 RepID=A0A3M7LZ42_9PLEO|nr:quinone reductase [Pyrenophora seminiperda CCB06]
MKGIQIKEYVESPDDLKVTDLPTPTPKPNEYLIAIHASATNFFDLLQVRGKYQTQPPFPWVAGMEFSGVVLKAPTALPGGKTPTFKEGDKVFGGNQGAYATHIICTEDMLKPVPEGWSYEDAAGMFVTGPTSYGGLVVRAGVKEGDWVLVHAAAGGVGLAAVQIAKAFGATVIATAGTPHKLDVARSFGADYAVNYRDADWPEQVKKLTPKGRGVDIVYDPVGLIDKSMKCIASNGRLLVIGFAGGPIEKIATNRILLKNVSVVGLFWGALSKQQPEVEAQVWNGLFKLVKEGKYRGTTFIDQEYVGLESIPAALKVLGGRDSWGKVVVKVLQEGAKLLRKHLEIMTTQHAIQQLTAEPPCTCGSKSSCCITQEPLAWSLTPSAIQDQNASPLYTLIPREIRDMIYTYALTDTTSYPVDRDIPQPQTSQGRRDRYLLMQCYQQSRLYPSDIAFPLLLTCKAIYLETYVTPLRVNPCIIRDLSTQVSKGMFKSWQMAEITGLDITLPQMALEAGPLFAALNVWNPGNRKQGVYVVPKEHLRCVDNDGHKRAGYGNYATSFNTVLVPVGKKLDKRPERLAKILDDAQSPPSITAAPCAVNKRYSLAQPLTHLTLRLRYLHWWTWTDDPLKSNAYQRLHIDPTFGYHRTVRGDTDLMHFLAAERRAGRPLDQVTGSCFDDGGGWGPQIGRILPDLKSLEFVFEIFKVKEEQLQNVVECAKTWRFAVGDVGEKLSGRKGHEMLVWDGMVVEKRWERGIAGLRLPKDANWCYRSNDFEVRVVRFVRRTIEDGEGYRL